jgi:hypothetical protein
MCENEKTLYDDHGRIKFDNVPSENNSTKKYDEFENPALNDDNGSKYREFERDWD